MNHMTDIQRELIITHSIKEHSGVVGETWLEKMLKGFESVDINSKSR